MKKDELFKKFYYKYLQKFCGWFIFQGEGFILWFTIIFVL